MKSSVVRIITSLSALAAIFAALLTTKSHSPAAPQTERLAFTIVLDQPPLTIEQTPQPSVPILQPDEGSVIIDNFATSPTGWRPAGGAIMEVTNRWQCDPRWTFFSLYNDRARGKPAVMWSKNFYPGDVTVEFYFAIKMDRERGEPYRYARDINVTIGSDGSDLRKGCTFSFGGENNTCSFIRRDGIDLRRVPVKIPTSMDIHHRWFRFRAERKDGRVTFQVDNLFITDSDDKVGELVAADPKPLTGDRIAIWTYDNAIMLAKVRVSGVGGIVTESPDFVPGELRTLYDK